MNLPVGTALAGAWGDCDIFIGSEFRIDVSGEAGNRFDQNPADTPPVLCPY